jgi:hypothetical protein
MATCYFTALTIAMNSSSVSKTRNGRLHSGERSYDSK